jgi:hypothetical protein
VAAGAEAIALAHDAIVAGGSPLDRLAAGLGAAPWPVLIHEALLWLAALGAALAALRGREAGLGEGGGDVRR